MHYVNGGAVASESPEAAEAAITILNQGGNAIDAAVATVAAQGVTRPFSGGIGGGGFMLIYLAKENQHIVLDHQAITSSAFGPESFINPQTDELYPEVVRTTSGMSVAVPGAIKGWEQALKEFGTMTLAEVLQPAIDIAEKGFVANDNLIREISEHADRFRLFESTKKIYLDKNGHIPKPGSIIKNPDLAKTYRLVAEHGSRIFYEGEIADAIVKSVQEPPFAGNPNFTKVNNNWKQDYGFVNGNLSKDDLRNYKTVIKEPTKITYRDYDVYGAPPVACGGVTISVALNILEHYNLSKISRTKAMHYYIEALKLAFADRSSYIGDETHTPIPIQGVLTKQFATERKEMIHDDQASSGQALCGNPWPYNKSTNFKETSSAKNARSNNGIILSDEVDPNSPETSTIHTTVCDKDGNIVSFTNTILYIGGSGIVVPGYGFLLNNMLFRVTPVNDPDHPDYPRPNMRPLSNMSPTIVMKDGKPIVALGSPGGETIMSTILQTLINYLDFGMSLEEAIAAPRLIQMNNDDGMTRYEEIFASEYKTKESHNLLEELSEMGHYFTPDKKVQGVGSVTAIEFLSDHKVRAIGEPTRRGGGAALVQYPTKKDSKRYIAE